MAHHNLEVLGSNPPPIGGEAAFCCWRVTPDGGYPDVPAGSLLYYVPDGKVPYEGLYVIRENKPQGKMLVRELWHEWNRIRLTKRAKGELLGDEIFIDVKDPNPEYDCCGKVRMAVINFM